MSQCVIYLPILVALFLQKLKAVYHFMTQTMERCMSLDRNLYSKSDFTTFGNSHVECTNGEWSSPPPKCQAA